MLRSHIMRHLIVMLSLLSLLSGCSTTSFSGSSITVTPVTPFTRQQAIERGLADARQSQPEVGIKLAEIDSATAELISLKEADRRTGGERGQGGYAPGQTANSPVWWVAVRGHFQFEGMPAAGGPDPAYEADERDLIYDARTGESVGSSIPSSRLVSPGTPRETVVEPSPTPTAAPGGFTVEENPVVKAAGGTPDRMEYYQLIPREVLQRHMQDRNWPPDRRVRSANAVIGKYGYRLQHDAMRSSYTYLLYKDNRLALDEIGGFDAPSENARGDDFIMLIRSDQNGDRLISKNKIADWKPNDPAGQPPIYFGNDLITATWQSSGGSAEGEVTVKQGERVLFSIPAQFAVDNPLKTFESWDGHWVMEVAGKLIVDGKNQNDALGYDEIFEWHLISGQPFYFFKKGDQIGVSYAGQVLPYRYEKVVHYQCCEPAMYNPSSTEDMIWFHALRGGMWYYVEMGVYS